MGNCPGMSFRPKGEIPKSLLFHNKSLERTVERQILSKEHFFNFETVGISRPTVSK
jgi:hypothetical protein